MSNGETLEQYYRRYYHHLLSVARRNCGGGDAESLVNDTAIQFLLHYDSARHGEPLAWLLLSLKRRCWSVYKREQRVVSWEIGACRAPFSRTPEEAAEDREDAYEGLRALGGLKEAEQVALLDQAAGFSYDEIAERRGWTYTKVNRCIAEGRVALREAA